MADVSPTHEDGPVGPVVRRVADFLDLAPADARALVSAASFQLCFVAAVAILKAASNALLLSRVHDPRVLPLLYVASALVTGGIAAYEAWSHPAKRWPPTLNFTGWVAGFLGLAAASQAGVPFAVEALYLAAEVAATTLSVRFWSRVAELFDVRVARQALGIIGGVGMAGSILGGLFTRTFGGWLGAPRLVPVAGLLFVGCLLLAPGVRNKPPSRASVLPPPRAANATSSWTYLSTHGLPIGMAILAALFSVLTALSDYLFRVRAKESMGEAELAALFGGLSVTIGVVAMTVQLVLTSSLLKRIGLFGYLLVTPVGVLVFAGLSLITPALWPAYLLKAWEQVGALSLTQTGMQLLYGPMPDSVRGAARSAVDGFGKKAGYALGGVVLVVLASVVGAQELAIAAIVVAFVVALVVARVRTSYVRAIGERLQAPDEADVESLLLRGGTARKVLEEALKSTDERRVLTALTLLSRDRSVRLEPFLVALLDHGSARVREEAAKLSAERGAQSCAVRLAELALADEPRVRHAAIDAVAVLRPFTAARMLGPLLEHPDLGIRAAAIAALVPLDPSGPAGKALDELLERGADANPGERALVARLLGRLGRGVYAKRLRVYLQDPTPLVRRAACEAAGRSGDPSLIDDLFGLLVSRETRVEARAALAKLGDPVLEAVAKLLNDRRQRSDLRYRLPRLLRDVGNEHALEVILFSNPVDDPFLQYRLSMAACRIRETHPDVPFDRRRAIDATHRRLDGYEALLPAARDLAVALGPSNLLVRALGDRLDQYLESAVRLAALVFPHRQVVNAYNRFVDGDAKTRPYAIELLEHTIEDRTLSRRLVGVLDRWHRRNDWADDGRIERAPARLLELLTTSDSVLRAFAVATVRQLGEARRKAIEQAAAIARDGGELGGSGIHALARLAKGAAWDVLLTAPPVIPEEGPMSEAIVEKVMFLEGVDIFQESDVDDLAAVAQYVREKRFSKGELIYAENDSGDSMFVIVEGQVRIEKERRHIVDLGPRDSFGETSLLDNNPRPATARALTDTRVLVLERADFLDLVTDRVELLRGIFRAVTKHLRNVLDAAAAGRITSPSLTPISLKATRQKTNPGTA